MAERERKLVSQAQRGDPEAAEKLLLACEALIWRICRALLPVEEDLEAAVQEVMVKVLHGVGSFRGDGSLASWVARVAVNHCRDLLRRRKLLSFVPLAGFSDNDDEEQGALPFPASDPDPERVMRAKEGVARMVAALQQLPSRQREVFVLRFFAHLDLKAIAFALGVDLGTVKTHLHRALARLRPYVLEAWP
ncbi:MAG: RNA polymerase sigma factor [Thermoanaerobaculum sp.]